MRLSPWLLSGLFPLLTACPCIAQSPLIQKAPIQDFRQWAPGHLYPVVTNDNRSKNDADLTFLRGIVGASHVIAFGEPIHNDHEVLEFRNRLIRYSVVQLGLRAVALETCLSSSKLLYDYVLSRSDESDTALKQAFCYGFGNYPEDLDLIHWLKTYNASQPPKSKVHFYGIDLTGQFSPTAFRSLDAVLIYLDKAAPVLGHEMRSKFEPLIPVFRTDRYIKLTEAQKDACTGSIQDLITLLRRERTLLTENTSPDDYEWALRQAIVASQDDAFLRSLPSEFDPSVPEWWKAYKPDPRWDHNAEMREVAMADNVLWVAERERERGKVLYFAHDEHVETGLGMLGAPGHPPPGQYQQIRSAGRYLRSALGSDLVVIGTYLGHGEGFGFSDDPAPAVHSMENLLGSVSSPQYVINLHELPSSGPLHEWFQTAHATRSTILRDATDSVAPLASYDDIFFTSHVSPSFLPHK
jgi:erythromycin esterase